MEASDGSSPDRKLSAYGKAIAIRRKHPVAVSAKMEASGGSEYRIRCCLPIAHRGLFPNPYANLPTSFVPSSHHFAVRLIFSFALRRAPPNSRRVFPEGVRLVFEQNQFLHWCRKLNLTERAVGVVQQIRSSGPARLVQSGRGNVSGRYPSRKMGVTIQFESHKNELARIVEVKSRPLSSKDPGPDATASQAAAKAKRRRIGQRNPARDEIGAKRA